MYSLARDLEEPKFPIGVFTVSNFLSDQEISTIFNLVNEDLLQKGTTGKDNTPSYLQYGDQADNDEARNSKITWIYLNKSNIPLKNLFKKIYNQIIDVNQDQFGFNLTDVEPFQFTTYSEGEYYKKHLDLDERYELGNTQRKLSFSIQLTDKSEYDGGELCLYTGENHVTASKEKGSISFFPSFMIHEVKEVTRGKRYSLVGWVNGPRFV